jgi:hypothetical protein
VAVAGILERLGVPPGEVEEVGGRVDADASCRAMSALNRRISPLYLRAWTTRDAARARRRRRATRRGPGRPRLVGVAPGLELEDEAAVPLVPSLPARKYVDPGAAGGGDVVFDGDLHVVVDIGPACSALEKRVYSSAQTEPIRGHASGLPLEPVDRAGARAG